MRTVALFIVGLGAQGAWWLSVVNGASAEHLLGLPWIPAVVIHASYLAAHLLCLALASSLPVRLSRKHTFACLGACIGIATGLSALLDNVSAAAGLQTALLSVAAFLNGVLYLGWMGSFSQLRKRGAQPWVILAAMACSSATWLASSSIASLSELGHWAIAASLPVGSGVLLERVNGRLQDAEPVATRKSGHREERPVLPPVVLVICFAFELAPGLLLGATQASASSETVLHSAYLVSALALLALTFATLASAKPERLNHVLNRLVVPLLSLGLLALALAHPKGSSISIAATITGSLIFEAFLSNRFANETIRSDSNPYRVFALGGLALQLGLLVSYLLGALLFTHAASTVAYAAISLVFLLILADSFEKSPMPPDAVKENHPQEPTSAKTPKGDLCPTSNEGKTHEKGAEEQVHAFAAHYGLTNREEEVLALTLRGKNIPSISEELVIATTTIKTHFKHIYRKTGSSGRQDLIRLYESYCQEPKE